MKKSLSVVHCLIDIEIQKFRFSGPKNSIVLKLLFCQTSQTIFIDKSPKKYRKYGNLFWEIKVEL